MFYINIFGKTDEDWETNSREAIWHTVVLLEPRTQQMSFYSEEPGTSG